MLRFEPSEKFVRVIRVFCGEYQVGRIANGLFEPWSEQDEYDAAELRQIADKLDELNTTPETP